MGTTTQPQYIDSFLSEKEFKKAAQIMAHALIAVAKKQLAQKEKAS